MYAKMVSSFLAKFVYQPEKIAFNIVIQRELAHLVNTDIESLMDGV